MVCFNIYFRLNAIDGSEGAAPLTTTSNQADFHNAQVKVFQTNIHNHVIFQNK